MHNITQPLKIIALALILSIGISYVSAWTAPTQSPPNGNTSAPLNVSTTGQVKAGSLGISGLLRGYGTAIFDLNVGVGTTAPNNTKGSVGYLDVNDAYLRDVGKWASEAVSSSGNFKNIANDTTLQTNNTVHGEIYQDVPGDYTFTVPSGVKRVWIKIMGGDGGGISLGGLGDGTGGRASGAGDGVAAGGAWGGGGAAGQNNGTMIAGTGSPNGGQGGGNLSTSRLGGKGGYKYGGAAVTGTQAAGGSGGGSLSGGGGGKTPSGNGTDGTFGQGGNGWGGTTCGGYGGGGMGHNGGGGATRVSLGTTLLAVAPGGGGGGHGDPGGSGNANGGGGGGGYYGGGGGGYQGGGGGGWGYTYLPGGALSSRIAFNTAWEFTLDVNAGEEITYLVAGAGNNCTAGTRSTGTKDGYVRIYW